ncbi:hypothetical protein [Streptomyces sp. 7-21]|uniref:hypothetical protein n=1 Tax=Streptomyces sp. 7-21 TaxID=2802283 RepID=UPI00191CB08B|nr:hypothetical protein [Streptomyces sp. 7-21]MBL1065913.1 hypothetical protein [Streptomyces sp. 7-21]
MGDVASVVVRVLGDEHSDDEERAELAQALRAELLQLEVESVDPLRAADGPAGAKGLGAVAGSLLVRLGVTTGLRALVAAVRRWAARDAARSVEIQFGDDVLKVTGISEERQEELIEVWLERHRSRG